MNLLHKTCSSVYMKTFYGCLHVNTLTNKLVASVSWNYFNIIMSAHTDLGMCPWSTPLNEDMSLCTWQDHSKELCLKAWSEWKAEAGKRWASSDQGNKKPDHLPIRWLPLSYFTERTSTFQYPWWSIMWILDSKWENRGGRKWKSDHLKLINVQLSAFV